MTQQDKELLLKDLCARLPYGVVVDPVDCGKAILIGIKDGGLLLFDTIHKKEYDKPWDIEYIKPYLRSMSSMTKEECIYLKQLNEDGAHYEVIDFCNERRLDYRGLIEKGLAIAVTEENNP